MKKAILIAALLNLISFDSYAQGFACGKVKCTKDSGRECALIAMPDGPYWTIPHKLPKEALEKAASLDGKCACVRGEIIPTAERERAFTSVVELDPFQGDELCSKKSAGLIDGFEGDSGGGGEFRNMGTGFWHM